MKRAVIAGLALAATTTITGCGSATPSKAVVASSPPTATYSYIGPLVATPPSPTYSASPTPTGPKQMTFGPLGWATVTASNGDSGNLMVEPPIFAVKDHSSYSPQSPKNGVYVVITVSAVGVSGAFNINPYDFYIRAADGTHYSGAFAQFEPALHAATLAPQEPIKGNLIFDVPDRTGTVVYTSGFSALGEWKF
jgi:hypothetical protein